MNHTAFGPCVFPCEQKDPLSGYCRYTACTNKEYNGSGTWYLKFCPYCSNTWLERDVLQNRCPNCGTITEQ